MRKFAITVLALISTIAMLLWSFFNYGYIPLMLHADTYDSYLDYTDYLVANFDDYDTVLNADTSNLDFYIKAEFKMDYYNTSLCTGQRIADVYLQTYVFKQTGELLGQWLTDTPDIYCSSTYQTYYLTMSLNLTQITTNEVYIQYMKNAILGIDDEYLQISNNFVIAGQAPYIGTNLVIQNATFKNWIEIDFNTTYLMSTFLLDSDFYAVTAPNGAKRIRPFVLYAETLTDRYNVYNDLLTTLLQDRYKYAITIPDIEAAIAVSKIGTGWESALYDFNLSVSSYSLYQNIWRMHAFNAAPMKTPYDNVTIDTNPNYSICDHVLGFPIDCTLNGEPVGSIQAMANDVWEWLIKESPIFSDIYTVAVGGFQWLGNALQFLGSFSPESILGGMIFLSAGVLLIVWGFKGE